MEMQKRYLGFNVVENTNIYDTKADVELNLEFVLCDPLTQLVSYPSFEKYVLRLMSDNQDKSMYFGIGDVDDLRGYVTAENNVGNNCFGHLAGNKCMAMVGHIVNKWESEFNQNFDELVCGTFGGDEVIIYAIGSDVLSFENALRELRDQIKIYSPRPCSFSWGSLLLNKFNKVSINQAYTSFLTEVDRCLFDYKAKARKSGRLINADIIKC